MDSTRRCIYCRSALIGRIPAEHVIPRSLATGFGGSNLTIRCVCADCNSLFGRDIEPSFVEDTALGVMRYEHGVKEDTRRAPPSDPNRLLLRYKGIRVELKPAPDGVGFLPYIPPQVGYAIIDSNKEDEFRYYSVDDLDQAESDTLIDKHRVHLVGQGIEGVEQVIKALNACGHKLKVIGNFHSLLPISNDGTFVNPVDLQMGSLIDRVVRRCMTKIAFNYLAFIVEAKLRSTEWLQLADFDIVREYVLQKDSQLAPFISTEIELTALNKNGKKAPLPLGHILTVAWSRYGADIEAKIILFSRFAWRVILARSYKGIVWDLRSGHYWSFQEKRVLPLQPE